MPAESAVKPLRQEPHPLGFNIGAIVLALSLLGLALAYAIDAASRNASRPAHRLDGTTTLTRTIGGKELDIPLAWFRYAEQHADGFAKQVDLHLELPLGPGGALRPVDVTLLPRSSVRKSSQLLDGVYLHVFQPIERNGPLGLVGKPLVANEGYEDETVWYDPLSADPFVAKCVAPVFGAAQQPRCIRAVHLAPGIAAIYGFGADVLQNWRDFDTEMRQRLARIGVF
jgi:hypothetical protein